MYEAARFRGNRRLHAIEMLRADVPHAHAHAHPRRWPCELRPGEFEFRANWLGVRDPLVLAG
jgi:hypothetical protein